jgi:amylosucrase
MQPLRLIYGRTEGFEGFILRLKAILESHWAQRPGDLKDLDLQRDLEPDWFLSEKMVGYVFYIDRFAKTLNGVLDYIDYLAELGITYVHFMPCLKPRPGPSDGGYSVMDYRAIDPRLGTMADFENVAKALRQKGMSVCIDLVLNHTAKEHEWAMKARAGDKKYQAYYRMFDTDAETEAYEKTLVEVFPNDAPGNFTFYPDVGKYVWTTFNEHQWDLNWANPQVFLEIVDIMLNLANKGATCLRLDAVAFMWKELGTNCQNLPEVHDLLQALRAATRIAAPAMIHKAEAIVAPRDLVPYLGAGPHRGREANLAYHNNLMVHYWSSLATKQTALMTHTLRAHFPESFRNACWATYIRCHDDIGWAITEEDAAAIPHVSGPGHRKFLADFYSGEYPASFARGGIFQKNEETGDRRNSGSFASLAGLEDARARADEAAVAVSIERILMGVALMASFGGLPLFYMGDEIGLLNDYSFANVTEHAQDNRWMHRPAMQWSKLDRIQQRILDGTKRIIGRRKSIHQLGAQNPTQILDTGNPTVFAVRRMGDEGPMVCLFNFSDAQQFVSAPLLNRHGVTRFFDCLEEKLLAPANDTLTLPPYARQWLT